MSERAYLWLPSSSRRGTASLSRVQARRLVSEQPCVSCQQVSMISTCKDRLDMPDTVGAYTGFAQCTSIHATLAVWRAFTLLESQYDFYSAKGTCLTFVFFTWQRAHALATSVAITLPPADPCVDPGLLRIVNSMMKMTLVGEAA
jgi:hypothetical protein